MSFGSSAETFGLEIIFGLGLLASLPVLLFITFLVQRILGIKSGWFMLISVTLIYVGGILGASFYLDSAGTLIEATVTDKDELIEFRHEGDWRRDYTVQVAYPFNGLETALMLRTNEAYFDTLREGGAVAIRTVSFNGWLTVARFANQSTLTWIRWDWLGLVLGTLLLIWLGWKLIYFTLGRVLVVISLLALAALPFLFKYQEWQRSENLSLTPLRATGVVEQVRRVTTIDPMPGNRSSGRDWNTKIEVTQLYDIVVVRYTPQGYEESIRAVDAVDASEWVLAPDQSVEIAYAADDPRNVRLLGETRFHHIRNPLEWLKQQAIGLGVLLVFLSAGVWGPWLWRKFVRGEQDDPFALR